MLAWRRTVSGFAMLKVNVKEYAARLLNAFRSENGQLLNSRFSPISKLLNFLDKWEEFVVLRYSLFVHR